MVSHATMPVIYLSHGAPPLAEDPTWPAELAQWAAALPDPAAVLIVSAHWERAPLTIGATSTVPLIYDFGGFPERFYGVRYAAPGAPGLAARIEALLTSEYPTRRAPGRGLDHGAYVPLAEMYPAADVPVLQISMPTLEPSELYRVGRALAPLREEGVLIIGSGFFTHNLSRIDMGGPATVVPQAWSAEFDQWGAEALHAGDVDSVLDFAHTAPAASIAHPSTEHLAPLFVALGAGADTAQASSVIDGYWYGLAKRSLQLGPTPPSSVFASRL